jgi:hypothetical protein
MDFWTGFEDAFVLTCETLVTIFIFTVTKAFPFDWRFVGFAVTSVYSRL